MALIIKGKMPTKCIECRFCNEFGDYPVCITMPMKVEENDVFPKGCPILGEIPDEHGDLIDRSFLKGASYEIMRFPDDEANKMYLELIDNAPTVVEATT